MSRFEAPLSTGQRFAEGVDHQLDNIIIGEHEASRGVAVCLLEGFQGPGVWSGEPGGGKTNLARAVAGLIRGMDEVAAVPAHSELRPQELVGGQVEVSKTVSDGSAMRTEKITTAIDSLLTPKTQLVIFDEINRTSPLALNAALELMEEGHVTTTAGRVAMSGIECIIATMNPSEGREGTSRLSGALASRFAVGVVLGNDKANAYERRRQLRHGWSEREHTVNPVATLGELHAMRRDKAKVAIPDSLDSRCFEVEDRLLSALRDKGIKESDGRMTRQLASIAKSLAYLGAQETVTEDNYNQAVRYLASARLGARSRNAYEEIPEVIEHALR